MVITDTGNGGVNWGDVAEESEEKQAELKERIDAPGREEKRRYTTRMGVKLTIEQKAEMADTLAKLRGDIDKEEAAKKAAADAHNATIKNLDQQIGDLSRQVRRGEVERDVQVAEVWDEHQGAVLTFRLDVDPPECINTRAMTAAERQGELPLESQADEEEASDEASEIESGEEPDDDTDEESTEDEDELDD